MIDSLYVTQNIWVMLLDISYGFDIFDVVDTANALLLKELGAIEKELDNSSTL